MQNLNFNFESTLQIFKKTVESSKKSGNMTKEEFKE